jgi:septal ring factor EnvC (AmiA/AmiB activator)
MTSSFEDDGTENLHEVSLKAATIVGLPAYQGRTQAIEFASLKEKENKIMEELEKIQKELEDTEKSLSTSEEKVEELKEQLKEHEGATEELTTLREFKASIDKEIKEEKALDGIKDKFSESKVEKEDDYFTDNREMLLSMNEDALEFMLQEFVSFASVKEDDDDDDDPQKIPNARNRKKSGFTPKEIAKQLVKESKESQ